MGNIRKISTLEKSLFRITRTALAGLLLAFAVAAQAQQPDIARAEQLAGEGKAAEAYALLEPLESQNAGDIRFDYLFGTVALDSGKPGSGCASSLAGRISGVFTGTTGQGAGLAYSLNTGGANGITVGGVAAFKR